MGAGPAYGAVQGATQGAIPREQRADRRSPFAQSNQFAKTKTEQTSESTNSQASEWPWRPLHRAWPYQPQSRRQRELACAGCALVLAFDRALLAVCGHLHRAAAQ